MKTTKNLLAEYNVRKLKAVIAEGQSTTGWYLTIDSMDDVQPLIRYSFYTKTAAEAQQRLTNILHSIRNNVCILTWEPCTKCGSRIVKCLSKQDRKSSPHTHPHQAR